MILRIEISVLVLISNLVVCKLLPAVFFFFQENGVPGFVEHAFSWFWHLSLISGPQRSPREGCPAMEEYCLPLMPRDMVPIHTYIYIYIYIYIYVCMDLNLLKPISIYLYWFKLIYVDLYQFGNAFIGFFYSFLYSKFVLFVFTDLVGPMGTGPGPTVG